MLGNIARGLAQNGSPPPFKGKLSDSPSTHARLVNSAPQRAVKMAGSPKRRNRTVALVSPATSNVSWECAVNGTVVANYDKGILVISCNRTKATP